MTAEHPRPTSRITDALLPPNLPTPPSAAPAPAPRVTAATTGETSERPAQGNAPAPAPAPTAHGTAERPTATSAAAPAAPRPAKAAGATPSPSQPQPQPQAVPLPAPPASPPAAGPGAGASGRTVVSAPLPQENAPLSPRQAPGTARARSAPNGAGDLPEVETTTRLRPIRDTSGTQRPTRATVPASPPTRAPATPPTYGYGLAATLPPEAPVETTTRLRPVRPRRTGRVLAVTACVVLGGGLIGGALAGIWLASAEPSRPAEPAGYTEAKDLWHNAPVDTLFPRTLPGPGAGPGAAARTWTRIVVAPDTACSKAVLAKGLLATLTPLGCESVLRATYTDATASSVITVSLVFTRADPEAQRALGQGGGLTARLGEDVPPALSGPSTVAARFGARQRASWWLSAPADLPVVVTAVSGFADGRAVDRPQPADRAMARGRTDATAQSGLGHEAKGITARFEALLRKAVAATVKEKENAR